MDGVGLKAPLMPAGRIHERKRNASGEVRACDVDGCAAGRPAAMVVALELPLARS